jgi:hypothetical protein
MGIQEETTRINDLIARWIARIQLSNATNFFDINRVAEDIGMQILNKVYNYELRNLNYEEKNYPGIDLGDIKNKIGFQITSRIDAKKIKDSLEKFIKKGVKKYSAGIYFLILTNEKLNFNRNQKQIFADIYHGFDPDKHILTVTDLKQDILHLYNKSHDTRFDIIKKLLEKEFADQAKKEDELVSTLWELDSSFTRRGWSRSLEPKDKRLLDAGLALFRYRSDKLTHFCSDKLIHLWFSSYV